MKTFRNKSCGVIMEKREIDITISKLEDILFILKKEQRNATTKISDFDLYEKKILGLLCEKEELEYNQISSSLFISQIMSIARCGNTRAYEIVDALMSQNKIGKQRIGRIVCYYSIPHETKKKDDWFDDETIETF